MAYMNADTYRQVGFRPYGLTNPRRAANLSGLGAAQHDLNRPFDPWVLHQDNLGDLGQNHPFDQDPGGWVLHGLGDLSPSMIQLAETSGISPADIQLLSQVGATDQDIESLVNGDISLAGLYANYGVTIHPPAAPGSSTTSVPASTAPTGNVESPPGSEVLYTAQFTSFNISGAAVITALNAELPAHGMQVTGQKVTATSALGTSPTGIQVQIADMIGHAKRADIKSVCDAILKEAAGDNLLHSQVDPVYTPGQSAPTLPPSTPLPGSPAGAGLTDLMSQQSIFPGITNEGLLFGALGLGVFVYLMKRR